jgi:adenylate kinase
MQVYQQQTAPLEDYYREQGLLTAVDGMGEIDAVQRAIETALQAS